MVNGQVSTRLQAFRVSLPPGSSSQQRLAERSSNLRRWLDPLGPAGRRLASGVWRLASGGWHLASGGWKLVGPLRVRERETGAARAAAGARARARARRGCL
ncbi:hypothetical protein BC831DRAFT_447792, partial [Entophlyctis helioformis]